MHQTSHTQHPILVTGMARSGTTWVARVLDSSGHTGLISEPLHLEPAVGAPHVEVSHWYQYVEPRSEGAYLEGIERLLRFDYRAWHELRRCRSAEEVESVARTWRRFRRSRGKRPLVKEPHAVFSARWFAERLGCDVVVTVRHPGAVVSSWKRLDWDFDFGHLLEQPALMEDMLGPYRQEMLDAADRDLVHRVALLWKLVYLVVARMRELVPGLVVVRHEDLSREPGAGFGHLFEAVGLDLTAAARSEVETSTAASNLKETPVDDPHLTRLDSRSNLGNWRDRLASEQIARIHDVTDDVASTYYAADEW